MLNIPVNVLVHCAKVEFRLVNPSVCVGCEHFAGFEDRFPDRDIPFGSRYTLLCRHDPVKRQILTVE